MEKMKMLKKIAATLLATITVLGAFPFNSFAAEERTGGADVYIGENVYEFDNASDAWAKAADPGNDAKIVLRGDWVADKDGSFGVGKNFEAGAMIIKFRHKKLIIDLNGYKIDRGLTQEKRGGELFRFFDCDYIEFMDSSEAKTGTITGGNNTNIAGAVYICGSDVKFSNITFTGNRSATKGGAFYIEDYSYSNYLRRANVTFDNCKFFGNEAKTGGAIYINVRCNLFIYDTEITGNKAQFDAGVHTEVSAVYKTELTLGGKVIIADNFTDNDGEGLMLDENLVIKVVINFDKNRPLDDDSRIVILSKTDDRTLRITEDSDDNNIGCFKYENDKYEIIAKGSGNDQYLNIKKS